MNAISQDHAGPSLIAKKYMSNSYQYHGYIDQVTNTHAIGWAKCYQHNEPIAVELWLGKQCIAHGIANLFRQDLAKSNIGEGYHAFHLLLVTPCPSLKNKRVTLKVSGTQYTIASIIAFHELPPLPPTTHILRSARLRRKLSCLPQQEWKTPQEAHQAIIQWLLTHSNTFSSTPSRSAISDIQHGRHCFAIRGASASGKTTLASQLQQHLQTLNIPSWLIKRDSFIHKETHRHWFDHKATLQLQKTIKQWLNNAIDSSCSDSTTNNLSPPLTSNGIVLIDDLRNMPKLPLTGTIYLFYHSKQLTQREQQRNQVIWSCWEKLRRQWNKQRFQQKLIKQALRTHSPCLIIFWNPKGCSRAWYMNCKPPI